jgi:hypothetical protein
MSNDDDIVGYGKPPIRTRFRPGQSGNPSGRPKGARNLKTDLMAELAETIQVREGDRSRSVSKQRALVKTLVAKALKGEARFAGLLITLILKSAEPAGGEPPVSAGDLADDDRAIIEDFLRRNSHTPPSL